jgi:hypothetical protein
MSDFHDLTLLFSQVFSHIREHNMEQLKSDINLRPPVYSNSLLSALLPFLFQIKDRKVLCHDASFILIWFHKRRVGSKGESDRGMGRGVI